MNVLAPVALDWRPLTVADAPALADLAADCLTVDGGLSSIADPHFVAQYYGLNGIHRSHAAWTPSGQLVAAQVAHQAGQQWRMLGHVHPAWRRRGLGTSLLEWAIDQTPADPAINELRIDAETMSASAQRLYAQFGFSMTLQEAIYTHPLTDIAPPEWSGEWSLLNWAPDRASLFFQAYVAAFRERPGFPGWSEAEWVEWASDSDDFCAPCSIVVLHQGAPAGFVVCDAGWISQIGVVPAWRGSELATSLLREVQWRMQRLGAPEVQLCVACNNPRAIRFYERNGMLRNGMRARFLRKRL